MKNLKIVTIILAIILLTLVTFGGVYIKTQNRMENKVKEYTLGRELEGERVIEVKVSTAEDSKPSEKDLTIQNYETVKNTIEERLNNLGAQDYTISLNKENGTITVELPEDDFTDTYVYFLTADSEVKVTEKDTTTELISDNMIKKSTFTYTANPEGQYKVYLELYLTKEGQTKIEEIKNNYAILADEVSEIESAQADKDDTEEKAEKEDDKETTEGEENKEGTKKIAILTIAGTEYDIESIEKNKIRVSIGNETSNSTYVNNYINAAAELAMLVNSGKYPISYEIGENRYVYADITKEQVMYVAVVILAVLLIVFVIFTVKYKIKGLLASISFIGFISLLSLILRYTNVNISIEGIGAIILTLIINIRINQIILKSTNSIDYKEITLKLIPIVIITLVFCFAGWTNLNSFGMVMFWGIVLIMTYNVLVTKTLLKLKESK